MNSLHGAQDHLWSSSFLPLIPCCTSHTRTPATSDPSPLLLIPYLCCLSLKYPCSCFLLLLRHLPGDGEMVAGLLFLSWSCLHLLVHAFICSTTKWSEVWFPRNRAWNGHSGAWNLIEGYSLEKSIGERGRRNSGKLWFLKKSTLSLIPGGAGGWVVP